MPQINAWSSLQQVRAELHQTLVKVRDYIHHLDESGDECYPRSGICGLVRDQWASRNNDSLWNGDYYRAKEIMQKGVREWPRYSGDPMYPVPSMSALRNASEAYDDTPSHWDVNRRGAKCYAKARRELLDFLIDYTKE